MINKEAMFGRSFKKYIASFFFPWPLQNDEHTHLHPRTEISHLPGPFSYAVALGRFSHDMDRQKTDLGRLIYLSKYRQSIEATERLAEFLIGYLEAPPFPDTPDIVVTIPDSIVNRQFSPVRYLAEAMGTAFGWEIRHDVIVRTRLEKPQKDRSFEDRLNDRRPRYCLKDSGIAQNRHVLIFDDIFATGMTLLEAGNLLLGCSPASVMALTLAKLSGSPK